MKAHGREALSVGERFRARAHASRIPTRAQIELTTRCPLRCIHCYVTDHSKPELPLDRVLGLVDELAGEGCMIVGLTGGEVGVREGWLEVAARVRSRGMMLTMITSGTAFSKGELIDLAGLRPSRVSVSLYGSTAERHEAITRAAGSFEASVETLRALTAAGVTCSISSVLMSQTIDDFQGIAALADDIGCGFMFDPTVIPCEDGNCDVVDYRVEPARLKDFYESELIGSRSRPGKVARAEDVPYRLPGNCDAGFTQAFIDASGEVYPCMGFPPSFGTLRGHSFHDVWFGMTAEAHRAAMERPLTGCEGCEIAGFCQTRCSRLAAVEDGDLSGPSRRACEITRITLEMRQELVDTL